MRGKRGLWMLVFGGLKFCKSSEYFSEQHLGENWSRFAAPCSHPRIRSMVSRLIGMV
jgi:hypothetical protein